ncbi:capping protein, Arp2/3 and myosin-I linker protein 2 isoform X3 [Betta splendens]|uniref:Capping protein, Arp2/3 and myosin-I linker protein 2 isoform X3 n=1 Tax=Betta splendens TaxID=158456 RepID=A0A6P7MS18_BETSP|nr:capping protein, Arp2/3 and myosin-I linker protein 2 isoform X3 [Betta splendens]
MDSISQNLQEQISELLKPNRVCLLIPIALHQSQSCGKSANRFLILSLWRGFLVTSKLPVRVENTFSYLEICSINVHSLTQIVLETDRQTLSFSALQIEDLEAVVSHITASLKRIFPDSSPGKLLKLVTPDLQQRLFTLAGAKEEQLNNHPGYCGGFSDTYAALCDFNEIPIREEVPWDVDNIYYVHKRRQFNLQDFSHLDSRDLALAVAALSFNQWFTKICSKELRLSLDVQQQLTFLLSRSPSLEELSLEDSGLKLDFAVKMAAALREHNSSSLQSVNLSGNAIEDKGVIALSQELGNLTKGLKYLSLSRVSMTARGIGYLSQVLSSNQLFSASLTHLLLSGNPSSLVTEEATFLFKFLSSSNCVSHLDLSDTNCPLDTLFVSLSAGCYRKLMHLNLARNPFSHRKVREVTRSIREFFSKSCKLKYVGLSGTRLPPQALRLLLQGLATNIHLSGLELDISSCELRSAGAQVIQEHISEATAVKSLDISDNSFENDMVTLVLSVGRCFSLRHLALGRNFAMKSSRALTDVLQRIAQLVQDEECALQSLSVCDSKLKTGMHILLSALGSHSALTELDISGNNIGDTGAKMLAKALVNNTKLRSLTWDRNNVTARGYQDVADALERNFTLQQVSLPLADITQHYRSNPEQTTEALHRIQQSLDRNNRTQLDRGGLLPGPKPQHSEKMLQGMCQQLEESLQLLNHSLPEVQANVLAAQEMVQNAKECFRLLPSLYTAGAELYSDEDLVKGILSSTAAALANEVTRNIQEMAESLMRSAAAMCPQLMQQCSVRESLSECVSKRSRQAQSFLRNVLVENTGRLIIDRLSELREMLGISLADTILEQMLQNLMMTQDKVNSLVKENACNAMKMTVPELHVVDSNFPTDDYSPAFWRNNFNCSSLRPAPSIKSLLDEDWKQQDREKGKEGGEGSLLSVTASSPSPSTSSLPSSPGWRGRKLREGEVAVVDAAVARARGASFIAPPDHPLLPSMAAPAPEKEAADYEGSCRPEPSISSCRLSPGLHPSSGSPASSMEPLPTQGHSLMHYTASRPRPRRTHMQPPSSRPQEPNVENETSDVTNRVDEGVEEFFTKKIIPVYALKGRLEESNPVQATSPALSSTRSASTTFSSLSDNITSHSITSSSVPSSEASLTSADLQPFSTSSTFPAPSLATNTIPALPPKNMKKKFGDFFAFKKARGRSGNTEGGERGNGMKVKRTSIADLIRPLGEAKNSEKERDERGDSNTSNDVATTVIAASSLHVAGETTLTSHSYSTTITTDITTFEGDVVPVLLHPSPGVTLSSVEPEKSSVLRAVSPHGDRQGKATKRSLREGKSQSLILLTGSEPEDKKTPHSKKHVPESSPCFEQRLQVMLQKMSLSKTPPADTRSHQKKDEELRKANSEGTILDKPEPPPTYMKPRTMSTSADPRNSMRGMEFNPKSALPEHSLVLLSPKLPVPPPPVPARPTSAPSSSKVEKDCLRAHPPDVTTQDRSQEPTGTDCAPGNGRVPSTWRRSCPQDCCEKAQLATDVADNHRKPCQHTKPLPQHRAVSVHEDALAITHELKAVLQRSPNRFQTNKRNLHACNKDSYTGRDTLTSQDDTEKQTAKKQKEALKAEKGENGCGCGLVPEEEKATGSTVQASVSQYFSLTAIPKAPSTPKRPKAAPYTLQKPPLLPPCQKKRPSSAPGHEQTSGSASAASEEFHRKKSPSTATATAEVRNSTRERDDMASNQHTADEDTERREEGRH